MPQNNSQVAKLAFKFVLIIGIVCAAMGFLYDRSIFTLIIFSVVCQFAALPTFLWGNAQAAKSRCGCGHCCFSEVQANEIAKHIDFVVGMNSAIGDKAASSFSEGFFDAFFADEKIPGCFKWGVNAIQLESIREDLTPVLKTRIAVKKTSERRPKKVSEVIISSTEEKPIALTTLLSRPMPKRAFLGLLISGFYTLFL